MKKRVSLLVMLGLTMGLFVGCGGDNGNVGAKKVKKIEIAFNQPENHPQYKALEKFVEGFEERTEGEYDVEIFPNELLGSQKETLEMTQSGSIGMTMVASSLLESWNSDFSVFNLPYVFETAEAQKEIIGNKEVVGELYDSLTEQGLKVVGGFHAGVRNIYTKNMINVKKTSDLKGQKIRVMQSDTNVKMLDLMGGTGTAMGQGEVYTAIQTGVLDGGENNELVYANLKHTEVAPNYVYTKHLMMPDFLVINNDLYKEMSDETKKIFDEELAEAMETEFTLFQEEVKVATEEAKKAGAKFTEIDITPFKEAVQPLLNEKISSDATKKIYSKIQEANKK